MPERAAAEFGCSRSNIIIITEPHKIKGKVGRKFLQRRNYGDHDHCCTRPHHQNIQFNSIHFFTVCTLQVSGSPFLSSGEEEWSWNGGSGVAVEETYMLPTTSKLRTRNLGLYRPNTGKEGKDGMRWWFYDMAVAWHEEDDDGDILIAVVVVRSGGGSWSRRWCWGIWDEMKGRRRRWRWNGEAMGATWVCI